MFGRSTRLPETSACSAEDLFSAAYTQKPPPDPLCFYPPWKPLPGLRGWFYGSFLCTCLPPLTELLEADGLLWYLLKGKLLIPLLSLWKRKPGPQGKHLLLSVSKSVKLKRSHLNFGEEARHIGTCFPFPLPALPKRPWQGTSPRSLVCQGGRAQGRAFHICYCLPVLASHRTDTGTVQLE